MKLFFSGVPRKEGFVELKAPGVSMGRELDNDLIVEAEAASRYHCKINWRDGEWYLQDLGSTNGTKLNGLKITGETKMKEGDEIAIGYQKYIFAENIDEKRQALGKDIDGLLQAVNSGPVGGTLAEKSAKKDTSPQSFFGSVFSKDQKRDSGDKPSTSAQADFFRKDKPAPVTEMEKKKHASVLFYVIVILFAFVLVAGFLLIDKLLAEQKKKASAPKKTDEVGAPLTVIYEKQISTPDNIFRYELKISNSSIMVERDDLKHFIRFRREQKLAPELLENLRHIIKETDFMDVSQPQSGVSIDNSDETKTLTIAYGTSLNSIRIKNAFEPVPFRDAVNALEDFSNDILNIPTISLTADEMKKEAEDAFAKAEMLFANKNARRENLKDAVKRYMYVIELLEFFEPKPTMYDQAYKKSQEAKKMLDEEVKQHEINAQQATKLRKFDEAIESYRSITEMLEPDDKHYNNAKNMIIKIEKHLRVIKKAKK